MQGPKIHLPGTAQVQQQVQNAHEQSMFVVSTRVNIAAQLMGHLSAIRYMVSLQDAQKKANPMGLDDDQLEDQGVKKEVRLTLDFSECADIAVHGADLLMAKMGLPKVQSRKVEE